MVFTQFGVAALAVAVVHLLEAAAKHPPMTKVAAALFFAIAGELSAPARDLWVPDSSTKQAMMQDCLQAKRLRTAAPRPSCSLVCGHHHQGFG